MRGDDPLPVEVDVGDIAGGGGVTGDGERVPIALGPPDLGVGQRHLVAGLGAVHPDAFGVVGLDQAKVDAELGRHVPAVAGLHEGDPLLAEVAGDQSHGPADLVRVDLVVDEDQDVQGAGCHPERAVGDLEVADVAVDPVPLT